MTAVGLANAAGGARREAERVTAALRFADLLSFVATPTFAIMALLTAVLDAGAPDVFCSPTHGSALSGMAVMYMLMGAFHVSPWLKLISARWTAAAVT